MQAVKPLHRSLGFWFGILLMLFIAWAWWDSMRYQSWVGGRHLNFGNSAGLVTIYLSSDPRVPSSGNSLYFQPEREEIVFTGSPALPSLRFMRGGGKQPSELGERPDTYQGMVEGLMALRPVEDWTLMVPHWIVLPGAATAWSGVLLGWRASRRRKIGPGEAWGDPVKRPGIDEKGRDG